MRVGKAQNCFDITHQTYPTGASTMVEDLLENSALKETVTWKRGTAAEACLNKMDCSFPSVQDLAGQPCNNIRDLS